MDLTQLSVTQFTHLLAGETATPAGGSAIALAAALCASLCAMTARLTAGRKKYHDSWEMMEGLKVKADELSSLFLRLVNDDAESYKAVMTAFKLPKETDVEKEIRRKTIEGAFKQATSVPLTVLENLSRLPDLFRMALEHGNPNCLADVGVGINLMRAAATGAANNIRVNLKNFVNREEAEMLLTHTEDLYSQIERASLQLEKIVKRRLG